MGTVKKHKLELLEKSQTKEAKLEDEETNIKDSKYEKQLADIPKGLVIYLNEIGTDDTQELSMRVNRYIKTILAKWDKIVEETTEDVGLIKETKKDLFPILVKLRKDTVEPNQLISILTIFYHFQRKEFLKANESYMNLSIGNTAWPIGVMSVSIHARSSQAKTGQSGANIMIDEVTRKWITGLKRLITFGEKHAE